MQASTLTFVIALLGLVTAVASLSWNVAQWLLTGGRARLALVCGLATGDGRMITVQPGPDMPSALAWHAGLNGLSNEPLIGVTVMNRGRLPVRVQRWGVSVPGGATGWITASDYGPALPAVIEAHAQETWAFDMGAAVRLAHASGVVMGAEPRLRVVAELGTGKKLVSRESMQVSP